VVDAVLGGDATHAVAGLAGAGLAGDSGTDTLVGALGRLRTAGAIGFGAALPVDGDPVGLRQREFELLVALVRAAGRVVTRDQLLADVWDVHWVTSTKTLDVHIHALRRKLEGVVDIVTIRGVGYRLEAS